MPYEPPPKTRLLQGTAIMRKSDSKVFFITGSYGAATQATRTISIEKHEWYWKGATVTTTRTLHPGDIIEEMVFDCTDTLTPTKIVVAAVYDDHAIAVEIVEFVDQDADPENGRYTTEGWEILT